MEWGINLSQIKNIRNTVWFYFIIFTTCILLILSLTFVVTLESTYKRLKTQDIFGIAEYILAGWSEGKIPVEELDNIAYENDMCILIQNYSGYTVYSYDMMAGNSLIEASNPLSLYAYRSAAKNSEGGIYYKEITDPRFNQNTLLFVMVVGKLDNPLGYIYLNTSLEPLKSTIDIIRMQIGGITLILIILGVIFSFFLSTLIEAPLTRLTKSAKKLGLGNYNVEFDGRGYAETEVLADALNYAANEISKTDSFRKDLIANTSHDLRTPLTMVKAYAEMIRDLSGDNPKKREEHIGIIIEESDRLANLVNDILDLSKLENGNIELNRSEFDLSEMIDDIMYPYKLFSEQKGYEFVVSAEIPFIVNADYIKLQQVLNNFINNALNYTGEDKTVYIREILKDKHTILVEITDTGNGIEEELLPLIFDRYYRTEKSKREKIGTGLGLSICKQILQNHDYNYGVRSEIGVGSTFWFEMDGYVEK